MQSLPRLLAPKEPCVSVAPRSRIASRTMTARQRVANPDLVRAELTFIAMLQHPIERFAPAAARTQSTRATIVRMRDDI